MDDAKKQLVEQLSGSTNILVTISRNPSIDQVASCIALTLLLNKFGKHAAAVFSGTVPSTLEFLKPEETLEKNTDSLRDFIIAIDKSKADKLRYKVEDDIVRIFITPYKTSISQEDLEFTQGDFNVDLVVALGVNQQQDLDEAITAHGRILHDATIASVNTSTEGDLGTINWHDEGASSLSELVTELAQALNANLIDEQIATALLTGIVSETDRFSNEKTSSQTMSISAALMAAGADQQLVASKLEENGEIPLMVQGGYTSTADGDDSQGVDGELEIDHSQSPKPEMTTEIESTGLPNFDYPKPTASDMLFKQPPDQTPREASSPLNTLSPGSKLITQPPTLGGQLTANSQVESLEPSSDPLSLPNQEPPQLLNRSDEPAKAPEQTTSSSQFTPPPPSWTAPKTDASVPAQSSNQSTVQNNNNTAPTKTNRTLTDLEQAVGSPHVNPANLDNARDEVSKALTDDTSVTEANEFPEPIAALNAQEFGGELHLMDGNTTASPPVTTVQVPDSASAVPPANEPVDPNSPPPVPPPIPFQFGTPPDQSSK